jgi:hypothetical protein
MRKVVRWSAAVVKGMRGGRVRGKPPSWTRGTGSTLGPAIIAAWTAGVRGRPARASNVALVRGVRVRSRVRRASEPRCLRALAMVWQRIAYGLSLAAGRTSLSRIAGGIMHQSTFHMTALAPLLVLASFACSSRPESHGSSASRETGEEALPTGDAGTSGDAALPTPIDAQDAQIGDAGASPSMSCVTIDQCANGEQCLLMRCTAQPLCVQVTASDGRFIAKNFSPGNYAAADAWAQSAANGGGYGISLATCETVGANMVTPGINACADTNEPVCGTSVDGSATYRNTCLFRAATISKAGATGEAVARAIPGACAPTLVWSIPLSVSAAALNSDGNLEALASNHLMEIDSTGAIVSDETFGATNGDMLQAFAKLSVVGDVFDGFPIRNYEVAIVRDNETSVVGLANCAGAVNWDVPVGGSVGRFGPKGDVYLSGSDAVGPIVIKLAAVDGSVLWSVHLVAGCGQLCIIRQNVLNLMTIDANGNVHVAGYRYFLPSPFSDNPEYESISAELDSDGHILSAGYQEGSIVRALAGDAEGRIALATVTAFSNARSDLRVAVETPAGGWFNNTPNYGHEQPGSLAMGTNGIVFFSFTTDSPLRTVTVGLGPDGNERWRLVENGLQVAPALVADDAGGVYLVSQTDIAKYRQ